MEAMTIAQLRAIIETLEAFIEDYLGDLNPGDTTLLTWVSGKTQIITIRA